MKEVFKGFALFMTLFWALSAQAATVTDATGEKVSLADSPRRVVTLMPSLAELVAEIGEGDMSRLVGVSEFSDFPKSLKSKPVVGTSARLNLEKILSLKPDLVLALKGGNSKDQIQRLRELRVPVIVVSTDSLKEIQESISLVASALGEKDRGAKLVRKFEQGLEDLRKRARTRKKKNVLIQVGHEPLVVIGGKSFLQEALELIRAENVYANSDSAYPRPALEDVLKRRPEVIVVLYNSGDIAGARKMKEAWGEFPALPAVKKGRVETMPGDEILRPTLQLLEGLRKLERKIHGET